MALTTAQQVRLRIQAPWQRGEEIQYGDGIASGFKLAQGQPYSTIISATASIVNTGWSATGCTIDESNGYVTFSGVISANSAVRFDYLWSVFSDDEIEYFTAVGGNVPGAALEAVRALMFDGLKRANWQTPDGTRYDDTRAIDLLKALEERLQAEVERADGPAGGFESWSIEQGNY
jgi:hypothetical protein